MFFFFRFYSGEYVDFKLFLVVQARWFDSSREQFNPGGKRAVPLIGPRLNRCYFPSVTVILLDLIDLYCMFDISLTNFFIFFRYVVGGSDVPAQKCSCVSQGN